MSSEMREVLESLLTMRAHAVGTDERCAEFQAYKRAACDFFTVHGDQIERTLLARTEAGADDPILRGLARAVCEIDPDDGRWVSCSGCYETEDGHPVGDYPHSPILCCALGAGCSECGGLGAVWDTTDYAAFAEEQMADHPQDASGDAEVLTAHGIKALDRCCEELRYWIGLADDMNFDEMTVSAFETAIESMEMRKANAMQAKESK